VTALQDPDRADDPPTARPFARPFAQPAQSRSFSPSTRPISIRSNRVFAKLKHLLRKAAARNPEAFVAATGELLGASTAHECANYFCQRWLRARLNSSRLSYDFLRRRGEKEPLGEGGCPLVSGEGRIGSTLTV
jgi:hypothetical protein